MKTKTTQWTDVRQKLTKVSQRDLIGLIGDLYKLTSQNKSFLHARFILSNELFEEYSRLLKSYIAPKEPWKRDIDIRKAKKVISDYKKATSDHLGVLKLKFLYFEWGTGFANEFGLDLESYYDSLESMVNSFIKDIKKLDHNNQRVYAIRFEAVRNRSHNMSGWYSELLEQIYKNNFSHLVSLINPDTLNNLLDEKIV